MELRHLRYFVATTEHGSLRKAAAALGVQESTVSRAVRDLEDRLGASLFHRHIGGVDLTIGGERFLYRVRIALQQIGSGIQDVAAIGCCENGCLRVGIFSSLASGFLAELLQAYDKSHPGVRIDLSDGNPDEHVAAIRQRALDVAFVTGTRDWSECETVTLWLERVFAALPKGHTLTRKEELDWSDLAGESFVVSNVAPGPELHDYLVQRLADLGHRPEINPQQVGRDNILSLVAAGRGMTLTSEATTVAQFPGVAYRPIAGEVLPFCAVWSPRNDNPALRRLLSMARSMSNGTVARWLGSTH
ncbi:LysR family transcriptional regulator [Kaustia mangrovi]|uniref:LysR family transcriptional regulator n=1 Tax=Kaustia mangrovi TaxID=2593653 RepID=A0A7S8HDX5_9HYPH|nr:LysR family transcriptional regulator [Kaustia mangrovi]